MIFNWTNEKQYKLIPCPYCGQDNTQVPYQATAHATIHCACGAEAHSADMDSAVIQWNQKNIEHPYFSMPEDELGQNKILITSLKQKIKQREAFYKEQLRKREIALDNLRCGRPEGADGGWSDYLANKMFFYKEREMF